MSYILEALKKSEMERQQRSLPELISAPARIGDPEAAKPSSRVGWGIGVFVVAAGLAGLIWWRFGTAPSGDGLVPSGEVPREAPSAAAPQSLAAGPKPPEAAGVAPPGGAAAGDGGSPLVRERTEPRPVPSPSAARDEPVQGAVAAKAPAARTPPTAPPAKAAKAASPEAEPDRVRDEDAEGSAPEDGASAATVSAEKGKGATAAAKAPVAREPVTPPPPNRVVSFAELPNSIRNSLPRISVAGHSFADDAAMRMVVINDRILREGEQVSAGVKLERIDGDGKLTLSYKGYRFRPPH